MTSQVRLSAEDKDNILQVLLNKYKYDRDRLKAALPEVVDRLDALSKPPSQNIGSPFGLTEVEATHYREELSRILQKLQRESLNKKKATSALVAWGALVYGGGVDEPYRRRGCGN